MTIATMTRGNLFGGEDPGDDRDPPTLEDPTMRYRVTSKMPQNVLRKVGLEVGDLVPEEHDEKQVARWLRRGRVEPFEAKEKKRRGGKEIETTEGGGERETRKAGTPPTEGPPKAPSDEGTAELEEEWPLKTPPDEYLRRWPNGANADLARVILAAREE